MSKRYKNSYKRKNGRIEERLYEAKTKPSLPSLSESNNKSYRTISKISDWLDNYKNSGVKPSTYKSNYYTYYRYIQPYFTDIDIKGVTTEQIKGFINSIHANNDLADSYKNILVSTFKQIIRYILQPEDFSAVEESFIKKKVISQDVSIFTKKEQRQIEDYIYRTKDIRAIAILISFYMGLRLGELCALKWKDINIESHYIYVSKTVTRFKDSQVSSEKSKLIIGTPKSKNSNRFIPIPDFMNDLYISPLNIVSKNKEYYVISDKSTPYDPRSLQKYYKNMLMEAGIEYRKFHSIRYQNFNKIQTFSKNMCIIPYSC